MTTEIKETKHPKVFTHIHEITLGITTCVPESVAEGELERLTEVVGTPEFESLTFKEKVLIKLMLEAHQNEGLEGFIRELTRQGLRLGLYDLLKSEFNSDNSGVSDISPIKVVSVSKLDNKAK